MLVVSKDNSDLIWDAQNEFWDKTTHCSNCESLPYNEDIIDNKCPICGYTIEGE